MGIESQRFLIIDDHFLLYQMVSRILKDLGATHVDRATDGRSGLAVIDKAHNDGTPYDVVFLDWSMPLMNGYEVLVNCRQKNRLDDMAIIMLSAESEDTNIIKALDAGATAYITKPFKPEIVAKKLEDVRLWREKKKAG